MTPGALEHRLNRLRIQFDLDSAPYSAGRMRWALTCRQTPVCTLVRVKETVSGLHKSVLMMDPNRVGFLATVAFVDIMKKVLQSSAPKDIVTQKTSRMAS